MSTTLYDVVIVGGGVVGLAILRTATLQGWRCALVEQEDDLLSWASGSNSGIVCTGVDASPGTLERALIRDSISNIRLFCREMNVPFRDCGSLVCLWPWDEDDRLDEVLHESWNAGDTHARRLTAEQVHQLEPHIQCLGAVHIPGEIVVDPWLYSIALAVHARQNGADICTNFAMDPVASFFCDGMWNIQRKRTNDESTSANTNPSILRSKAVVNAAGLWADLVQSQAQIKCHWTAQPRRGQYRVYSSPKPSSLTRPIQPIPTQRTKGIFVFSTLYDQLVVGPTALDQESRDDRSVDPIVSAELEKQLLRILPTIDPVHVGDYVGIRPGTDHRDYQISVDAHQNWIACAGIRSTGLTASLGIGRHVTHLLTNILHPPETPRKTMQTNSLPDVKSLVKNYQERNDGKVLIDGYSYRVTHPLTRFGWDAQSGLAQP